MEFKYCLLALFLCLQVLTGKSKSVENECKGNGVGQWTVFSVEDACFQIVQEPGVWFDAVRNCNDTGGELMKMNDRYQLLQAIRGAVNVSGNYWIGRSLDIQIYTGRSPWFRTEKTLENSCPWMSVIESPGDELQLTIHLPTEQNCFREFYRISGYICKYETDTIQVLSTFEEDHSVAVLLPALIAVGVVAFVLLVALIILGALYRRKKKPKKSLYFAATTTDRPEMYDAPAESHDSVHDSDVQRPLVYDVPLEDKDFVEQETVVTTTKKPRSRFPFFGSGGPQAAQAVVTHKHQRKGSGKGDRYSKQMVDIRKKPHTTDIDTKDTGQDERKTQRKSVLDDPRRSDLKVIERGKVGKVASLFEGPKNTTDSDEKGRKASEEKIELKQSISIPDNKRVSPKPTKEQKPVKKEDPKVKSKEREDTKGKETDKDSSGKKSKIQGSDPVMTRNESDIQRKKRKEEEKLKQEEIDKEIEKQRVLANQKADEAPEHVYMYVEEEDTKGNVNNDVMDETYEPVLVYEN